MEFENDVEGAYRKYFPILRDKCRRTLRDPSEAEDVAQEAFARLWRDRGSLSGEPRVVTAWLYRTATRLTVDRLRARKLEPHVTVPEQTDARSPEAIVGSRSELEGLATRLAPEDLAVLILGRVDGLVQTEIAAVLGVSERTVRRALVRSEEALASWQEGRA